MATKKTHRPSETIEREAQALARQQEAVREKRLALRRELDEALIHEGKALARPIAQEDEDED